MKFKVSEGIKDHHVDQLIFYSKTDEAVRKTTLDGKRFKNKKKYEKWLKKRRIVYVMEDNNNDLAGILWFGAMEIPPDRSYLVNFDKQKYGVTFAIRIYEKHRGKGLAKVLMKDAFDKFINSHHFEKITNKGFWLSTYTDNLPAVSAYKNFGFEIVSKPDIKNRIIMIYE